DPITQREYYAVRAVFEPHNVRTDRLPGFLDVKVNGLPRVYDAQPAAPTYFFHRGDDRTPDTSKAIPPGVPEAPGRACTGRRAASGGGAAVEPAPSPRAASAPDRRPFVVAEPRRAAADAAAQARSGLEAARSAAARAALQTLTGDPLGATVALRAGERAADA